MVDRSLGDQDFGVALTALLRAAGLTPDGVRAQLRDRRWLVSRSTLYEWMKNEHLPEDDGPLMEIVSLCLATARRRGVSVAPAPEDVRGWQQLLGEAKHARDARVASVGRTGGRRAGTTRSDAFIQRWHPVALGVHRAIGGGPLPRYVRRHHDELLRWVLDPAVIPSRIVVLRGGSSTGKTRAAYEAVRDCLPDWRVDYPRTAAILARRLQDSFAPRTVVWLDELWHYTDPDTEVLAELNDMLTGSIRVVVIATLWPMHWGAYTRPGPVYGPPSPPGEQAETFGGVRSLLKWLPELSKKTDEVDPALGGVIDVPDRFTAAELVCAQRQGDQAVVSAVAAAEAAGSAGMVAQYLAGVPDLEEHYAGSGADPYGQAVITAAMDMARFGHAGPYPTALLHQAVVGYLNDSLRTVDQDRWWRQSLEYATRVLKGAVAALMPVPPLEGTGVEGYRLADYLDQQGRRIRQTSLGPPSLWEALAAHTSQGAELSRLGQSAYDRGLYRYAVILWKKAILAGGVSAIHDLLKVLRSVEPRSVRQAAKWVAEHAPVDSPAAAAEVYRTLHRARQKKAASAFATRAAALAALDDPYALAGFLDALNPSESSAIRTMAARLTKSVPGSIGISSKLVQTLDAAGEEEAVVALAVGLARRGDLSNPRSVTLALHMTRKCGDQGQSARKMLLDRRPAEHVGLDDSGAIAELLQAFQEVEAGQAATILAHRAADGAALDDPKDVIALLGVFSTAGQDKAMARLLARHPVEQVALSDARHITSLFKLLREIGQPDIAAALGRRFASEAPLDEPRGLDRLFHQLVEAGERETASRLASRAVAQRALRRLAVDVLCTWDAVFLIGEFYKAGEEQAAIALASQIVEQDGPIRPWRHSGVSDLLAVARRMRWEYGTAAAKAITGSLVSHQYVQGPLDNPRRIANNIKWLDRAAATDAIAVLLSRQPADNVFLGNPEDVGMLLGALRRLDASDSVMALIARRPEEHAVIGDAGGVARLLDELLRAGAMDAANSLILRAADQVKISDAKGAARLLDSLHKAGATDLANKLARQVADHINLADAFGASELLKALVPLDLPEVVAAMAMRSAEQALDDDNHTFDTGSLLDTLNQIGARQAFTVLAYRAADAGHFAQLVQLGLAANFKFGRGLDGIASQPWRWQDL